MNIDSLIQYARMQREEDIKQFEIGVWNLAKTKDFKTLKSLLSLFDDSCPYPEVMYSLVHAIESYPKEIYMDAIMKNMASLVEKSPFWADCLYNRIFNDKGYISLFKESLHIPPKEALFQLFNIMEKESPHHHRVIEELKEKLETSKN